MEYILYEKRCELDGMIIYDALSAEDYERIYPILMCCSFPMNTFEDFHKGNPMNYTMYFNIVLIFVTGLFTAEDQIVYETEGELSLLGSKIRSLTNDRVNLLPISRTLYELFYLQ